MASLNRFQQEGKKTVITTLPPKPCIAEAETERGEPAPKRRKERAKFSPRILTFSLRGQLDESTKEEEGKGKRLPGRNQEQGTVQWAGGKKKKGREKRCTSLALL